MRVLAPALRGHGRRGSLQDLQQGLLHPLAGDVPGDRGVLALAGHLVDLVDVDDPGLGLLDVVVGCLDQLQEDVLDVLAHVTGLGEGRGIGDGERNIQHPGERLGHQGLAATGGAQQQDVGLGQLHLDAGTGPGADPLVVVVDGHGKDLLGLFLADDVVVQECVDLPRTGKLTQRGLGRLGELLLDDLVAEVYALVADVDTRAGNELLDLLLGLATEGTLEEFALTELRHTRPPVP